MDSKKLNENLRRELKELDEILMGTELTELKNKVAKGVYSEQISLLIDMLFVAMDMMDTISLKLNDVSYMEDTADEIQNLISQELILDLVETLSEVITILSLSKHDLEVFVDKFNEPPKILALKLALDLFGRASKIVW